MNKKTVDVLVVGFALFSISFGAGNLLFPPYLGVISGSSWLTSLLGFLLSDVGLSLLVIVVSSKYNGNLDKVLGRAGKNFSRILSIASILCIGPLLAIPRTAATTYEMGISPIIGSTDTTTAVIASVVFFLLTLLLTIKSSKVIDIIGKFLTPILIILLGVLIVIGIISPIGDVSETAQIENLFAQGISQGYLTMDTLGAIGLSTVIVSSIREKGYKNTNERVKFTIKSCFVASLFLSLVYGGLTYLGSMLSTKYGIDTPQASLMVVITNSLLGYPGKLVLGIIVSLACLTTAIGLTSVSGKYFSEITNNKISYEAVVIMVCVFSAVVSNFGVGEIINFSLPILSIIYPVVVSLIITTLFGDYIKNDNVFKGVAYITTVVSLLSVASTYLEITVLSDILAKLPLASLGFNWIVPAIVGGLIGSFIKTKNSYKSSLNSDLG